MKTGENFRDWSHGKRTKIHHRYLFGLRVNGTLIKGTR